MGWTTDMTYRCLKMADNERDSSRSTTLSHLSKDLEFTTVVWRYLALHLTSLTYFFREIVSFKMSRRQFRRWPANKMPSTHCACQSRSDFSRTHEVARVCSHDIVCPSLRFDSRPSVFTWSQTDQMIGPSAKRPDVYRTDDLINLGFKECILR